MFCVLRFFFYYYLGLFGSHLLTILLAYSTTTRPSLYNDLIEVFLGSTEVLCVQSDAYSSSKENYLHFDFPTEALQVYIANNGCYDT